ncbi:hypothetical protein HAX54_009233 [Datura stramonium]|uniref:Uncharacterized protein n=1 Tax=Datura stramonium TaxID=4076 RepID=A0ABS8RIW6_DATST|nr:hypothetical protein [Datura stramonium]
MAGSNSDRPPLPVMNHMQSERRKGKTSSKKKEQLALPDYVNVPQTVFSLSEKPVCTFNSHQENVTGLLCWSSSQMRFDAATAISMDKTVRLWDIETQSCLKMFAHNDYGEIPCYIVATHQSTPVLNLPSHILKSDESLCAVTCIHFNPVGGDHFISGSLDGKVRIWNVSNRKVVDWTDLHEMVTATCYSPDGEVAISPTLFSDMPKLLPLNCRDLSNPELVHVSLLSPAEVLKFPEYKQPNFCFIQSRLRKYILSASEDSQLPFHWPGSIKNQPPLVDQINSKGIQTFPCHPEPTNELSHEKYNSAGANSKRNLPPLPAKKNSAVEKTQTCQDEDSAQDSPTDPGIGASESFSSSSPSIRDGDSPSMSSSSRFDGSNNQGNSVIQSTAWGMVIVTASTGAKSSLSKLWDASES